MGSNLENRGSYLGNKCSMYRKRKGSLKYSRLRTTVFFNTVARRVGIMMMMWILHGRSGRPKMQEIKDVIRTKLQVPWLRSYNHWAWGLIKRCKWDWINWNHLILNNCTTKDQYPICSTLHTCPPSCHRRRIFSQAKERRLLQEAPVRVPEARETRDMEPYKIVSRHH